MTSTHESIHYLDSNGKPDSVQVDAVLSYDVVVNTLPRVVRKHVNIDNGKHNVISFAVPQGYIKSVTRNV